MQHYPPLLLKAPEPFNQFLRQVGSLRELQIAVADFSREKFVGQTLQGIVNHLKREAGEVAIKPNDLMEYADVLILWCEALTKNGVDVDTLVGVAWIKLDICRRRKWQPMDAEGVFQHAEEA